jgi:uncharacterized RDD family membrane protein YckC
MNNIKLSSRKSRIKAFIIDEIFISIIFLIIFYNDIYLLNSDTKTIIFQINSKFIEIFLLKFIYQVFFIWYFQATIGKMIFKIRVITVINDDIIRASLFISIIRSINRIISEIFFYIGFLILFFDTNKQTFHDKISKTIVVDV